VDRPDNAFQLRPLQKYTADRWFTNVAVGVNTLGSIVSDLCKSAGFVDFFSNRSLRTTAASRLFVANIDEQLVKLKTCHVSDAVRSYKSVNDKQLSAMSDIISSKVVKINDKSKDAGAENFSEGASETVLDRRSLSGILSECHFNGTVNININLQ
jgi:hypothetical protein